MSGKSKKQDRSDDTNRKIRKQQQKERTRQRNRERKQAQDVDFTTLTHDSSRQEIFTPAGAEKRKEEIKIAWDGGKDCSDEECCRGNARGERHGMLCKKCWEKVALGKLVECISCGVYISCESDQRKHFILRGGDEDKFRVKRMCDFCELKEALFTT